MTNRAQAKPTKDPKDPIQQQSLVGPAFFSALAVVLTIVWLVVDDFWTTKPWKAHQNAYQSIAVNFLAERLVSEIDQISDEDVAINAELQEIVNQLRADEDYQRMMSELDPQSAELEKLIRAIDGLVKDPFWKAEKASEQAAWKYQKEHGINKVSDEEYRATLDEVNNRTALTVKLRLFVERLKSRKPDIEAAISRLESRMNARLSQIRNTRQALESFSSFRRDFVQVYKSHGGSADIVDRCESCHRGASETYLDRNQMWASHLSNDVARAFVEKTVKSGKNYYRFKQPRLEALYEAERVSGAHEAGSFFVNDFVTDEAAAVKGFKAADAKSFMRVADLAAVEQLMRGHPDFEGEAANLRSVWHAKNAWRGSPIFTSFGLPEEAEPTEEGEAPPVRGLRERDVMLASETSVKLATKHGVFDEGYYGATPDSDPPAWMLAGEALLWLATEGPQKLDGGMRYPDRFGIGNRSWFQAAVNDPRVRELYQNLYLDFRAHIKEQLLMYTAHPKREEIFSNHARDQFGCMSCHRGFGLHAKSMRDAHGRQAHWLVPLFKEGYQEAGCQKCHKKDIELAGATRIQKGKDLYYDLGCWGCHAYEGYESEAGDKLRTAKDTRDLQAVRDSLTAEIAAARAQLATEFLIKAQEDGAIANDYAHRLMLGGMSEAQATAAALRAESALLEKVGELERRESTLTSQHSALVTRADELDREHKKKGPSLLDLTLKVGENNKGWVANWIRYPKNFRPSTKMPHFFYGTLDFLDEKKIADALTAEMEAEGHGVFEAFGVDSADHPDNGNPLKRRYNAQTVRNMKSIVSYVWQAAKVSAELGDSNPVSNHAVPVGDAQAIADGRVLFSQGTGCVSCHSVEPDLVKGTAVVPFTRYSPGEAGADSRGFVTEHKMLGGEGQSPLWMAAPKYQYRVDGTLAKDGHTNIMANEFIYGMAANLSRIGEKADPNYLVEWILQPRVRNKHSIMPSFMTEIAGTPPGAERDALTATIAQLSSRTDPAGRLLLADARRRRGDITPDALALYRNVFNDAAVKSANVPNRGQLLDKLENALRGYERARLIAAFLMSLKNPELSQLGHMSEENGWIPDYSYAAKVWTPDLEASVREGGVDGPTGFSALRERAREEANHEVAPDKQTVRLNKENRAIARGEMGMFEQPKGTFEPQIVNVSGFGDYSFMDEDYAEFRNARRVQRAAGQLSKLAAAARDAASDYAFKVTPESTIAFQRAITIFGNAFASLGADLGALQGASGDIADSTFDKDYLSGVLAESQAGLESIPGRMISSVNGLSRTDAAAVGNGYAQIKVAIDRLDLAGRDYEQFTTAGRGKRYTAYYGCAGCHQIEGMEAEGKVGVELTEEGSKFIQRLDFGQLEMHSIPEDPHTPDSPRWLTLGSLRGYDPNYTPLGDYRSLTPETQPMVRGGPGFELPAGIKNRYIRSKYDYRNRSAWFQGKLHNPRQWDKGRWLEHEQGWFERTRMPLFELNDYEILAITTFIEGSENLTVWGAGGDDLPANEYIYNYDGSKDDIQKGWWIVKKYNCVGCHSIGPYEGRYRRLAKLDYGGFANAHGGDFPEVRPIRLVDSEINVPPILPDAGARLKGEWMVSWLRDPYNVRNLSYPGTSEVNSWVQGPHRVGGVVNTTNGGVDWPTRSDKPMDLVSARVIMPQFYLTDSEARAIQKLLLALAGAQEVDVAPAKPSSPEAIAFGEQIFLHGACLSCHGIDEKQNNYYTPGGKAPNLRGVAERTRREWVTRWLKNPDAIQPRGRMYHYFRYDLATSRWVIADLVNNADYKPRVEAGVKSSAELQYDGDHVEALAAWLFEGLQNQRTADLLPKYNDVQSKAGGN